MKKKKCPQYKIPREKWFAASPSSHSHHNHIINNITRKLNGEELQLFKDGVFGHLLMIKDIVFSCQLAHALLLRQIKSRIEDGVEFLIGESITSFREHDFALVTGLQCGQIPDASSETSMLKDRYFRDEDVIPLWRLEEAFLACDNRNDIFMLALVLFAEGVLHGRERTKPMDIRFLSLVEDIDNFNSYPWGSFAWKHTFQSLREGVVGRDKGIDRRHNEFGGVVKERYKLRGFPLGLQAWAYEVIPDLLRYGFVNKNIIGPQLPRIITWTTPSIPPRESRLSAHIFEADPPTKVISLVPTPNERQQRYWTWGNLYTTVVRVSYSHPYSQSCGENLVGCDKPPESFHVQHGPRMDIILNELHQMKSMIASQMQRMGKDIRIIKSRLPTRKSANQGRGGRMKSADYLATEVDTGKEKSTCDGDPSQQTQVGHEDTYGWDIDEDYIHHRNDLSHLHVNDKTKSAQDHDAAEHAEIRKQGSSAIMAKFRSPDQETIRISGDHQFTLGEDFGLVSLNRKKQLLVEEDNAQSDGVEQRTLSTLNGNEQSVEKGLEGNTITPSCDHIQFPTISSEGLEDDETGVSLTLESDTAVDADLAESMCFSLKKGICLRKHANEMGRNCDWERTNSFEHSLVSTLMTVGVGGTMQSHLNQEHPNSNKLLTNEEQSHLERVIFSLVDQEESNTEGDRVTIRDKNQGDAEVECYPVGSSQLEVGMPNIDYCEQPTVDVPSNQVQRRSIRNKRPGPQLLSPFACAIPYKKRKVGQYNPLSPAPRKLRDGLRQFIEKWKHSPCDDVNIVNNVVDQQFILDIIDVGAWLSNQHIDIGLHLLRKRGVDFPDMFGKNWTTVDHSFSEFVISDYNRYKDVSDMSTWSPDTRLEQYVRGLRPAFSLPWEAVDMIYVPFLVSHNHWVAIVIDMVNHSMKLYDSYVRLNTDGQMSDYIHPIAYMFPHLLNKYGLVAKGHSNTGLLTPWPVHRVDNVPQQSHDDCGVYTLKFIDCLTAKFELVNWSKYDIKSIRLRMAVEFMCGSAYL